VIGLLKTLILGRENGIRAAIRRAVLGGDRDTDTSPHSSYSAPTYTPPAAPEPPRGVTPPEGFEVVLHRDAVAPGEVVEVISAGTAIAVGNVDGEFYAVGNTCAHAEGPLGEGSLDGNVLTCPYHGWTYDIKTGACLTNTNECVDSYEVAIEGDAVCVRM
jgi:nitrite reductase/ring-hydroxylating ferredoxin subunit